VYEGAHERAWHFALAVRIHSQGDALVMVERAFFFLLREGDETERS